MKIDLARIRPRKGIALVEIIKETDPKRGNIYLPRPDTTNFDLAVIHALGDDIEDLKKGDIVYVHHGIMEEIEINSGVGFIRNERIMAVEVRPKTNQMAN